MSLIIVGLPSYVYHEEKVIKLTQQRISSNFLIIFSGWGTKTFLKKRRKMETWKL